VKRCRGGLHETLPYCTAIYDWNVPSGCRWGRRRARIIRTLGVGLMQNGTSGVSQLSGDGDARVVDGQGWPCYMRRGTCVTLLAACPEIGGDSWRESLLLDELGDADA
jgi:hypothetical protein